MHPVERLYYKGIDDFNNKNLISFLEQFADDISMFANSGWVRGKSEVEKRFSDIFTTFPDMYMKISNFQLNELSDSIVLVEFQWSLYLKGNEIYEEGFHGAGTGIYVKRNGRWMEVHEHETTTYMPER